MSNPSVPAETRPRRRAFIPVLAVAVAVLATGGSALLGWKQWQAQPVFVQAYETQRGQQLNATLPDGSRLQLDSASRVDIAFYEKRREVKLSEGQALFAVPDDPARPFQVVAGPVRVMAGTARFAVRNTPYLRGEDGLNVAVEQGKVDVEPTKSSAGAVALTAGQQVSGDAEGKLSAPSAIAVADIASWRTYRVAFHGQRLDNALSELSRYGDVPLVLRDPAVAALKVTGTFDPRDLPAFLQALPAIAPVRLQKNAAGATEVVAAR